MIRRALTRAPAIPIVLCLQFIPLLLFPSQSYMSTSQEWWLPALLAFFALIGVIQLLIRRSPAAWPWYLISFAQGFNIISRLMLLMPHAMIVVDGQDRFNSPYVLMSVAAMLWSGFLLWYCELPEVRGSVFRDRAARTAA